MVLMHLLVNLQRKADQNQTDHQDQKKKVKEL